MRKRGVTLVELVFSVAIMLIVIAGALTSAKVAQDTLEWQWADSFTQDYGRWAIQSLSEELSGARLSYSDAHHFYAFPRILKYQVPVDPNNDGDYMDPMTPGSVLWGAPSFGMDGGIYQADPRAMVVVEWRNDPDVDSLIDEAVLQKNINALVECGPSGSGADTTDKFQLGSLWYHTQDTGETAGRIRTNSFGGAVDPAGNYIVGSGRFCITNPTGGTQYFACPGGTCYDSKLYTHSPILYSEPKGYTKVGLNGCDVDGKTLIPVSDAEAGLHVGDIDGDGRQDPIFWTVPPLLMPEGRPQTIRIRVFALRVTVSNDVIFQEFSTDVVLRNGQPAETAP